MKQSPSIMIDKKAVHILAVEDSPTQLQEIKYYLQKEGYSVVGAKDGQEALEQIKKSLPTIIISDIVMPNIDGYGLCKAVKENPDTSSIPFVLLTSLTDPKDIIKSIEAGANKFLTKPFEPDMLNNVILELLLNYEKRRNTKIDAGIKLIFGGEEHLIKSDSVQLLDLLLSSYESAFLKNKDLLEAKDKLEMLNLQLELKVQQRTEELRNKEKMMIAQSRSAAMGDMIAMIAHQWKQPLAILSMVANNMKVDYQLGDAKSEDFETYANDISKQVMQLSNTIDDFRDFFKPTNKRDKYPISRVVDDTLSLIGKSLENHNITVIKDCQDVELIEIFHNELSHVLLNIIVNAREVLIERGIKDKKIFLKVYQDGQSIKIEIEDSAGGVPEDIIGNIFEPYFTTKNKINGTGLGLYMSKTIIEEHFKGRIEVSNSEIGAKFVIILPIDK